MDQRTRFLVIFGGGLILIALALGTLLRLSGDGSTTAEIATEAAREAETQPRAIPTGAGVSSSGEGTYVVQAGDTLNAIAQRNGVSAESLISANNIINPDLLEVGQRLIIPGQQQAAARTLLSSRILIPDDELIYGPSGKDFDLDEIVPSNSFLRGYSDTIEGATLDGIAVIDLVAERTRVHPRLLLAALEHRAGWVTQSTPAVRDRPMGATSVDSGLYRQLEWAANKFNLGFYGRSEGGLTGFNVSDGTPGVFAEEINHGTAGVQLWLGSHAGASADVWLREADGGEFMETYERLFGDPFDLSDGDDAVALPNQQPSLNLPWDNTETWFFTGGPHGGWISGSGWAALDFVPPGNQLGCYVSENWVLAVADGVITRSDFGAVVLDLDGDGYEGTGWAIVYQHVATTDRIEVGERVQQGERIGRASCEGGFSSGTHLHIGRTHNGRWVSADSPNLPFDLAGWRAAGAGSEYNGTLTKNGVVREATIGRLPANSISVDP